MQPMPAPSGSIWSSLNEESGCPGTDKGCHKLRPGIPCRVPALDALERNDPKALDLIMSQIGGQSCYVDVLFEGAVVWLARFRLVNDPTLPPKHVSNHILFSDIATMYDSANTSVKVPKVYYLGSKDSQANAVSCPSF
jgi:hypothetical protein